MRLSRSLFWQTLAPALLIAVTGCGPGGSAAIKTDLVEGVVTLDGQAVEGATVTFVPVQEGAGAAATGMTDAAGKYRLTAVGEGQGGAAGAGTLPGEYYVGVLKDEYPGIPAPGEEQETIEQVDPRSAAGSQTYHSPEVQ